MELSDIYSLFVSGVPIGALIAAIFWLIGYVASWAYRKLLGGA